MNQERNKMNYYQQASDFNYKNIQQTNRIEPLRRALDNRAYGERKKCRKKVSSYHDLIDERACLASLSHHHLIVIAIR
jgi:hypothetical protein